MTSFTKRLLRVSPEKAADFSRPVFSGEGVEMLYIHIPFCKELCAFCSFNRTTFQEAVAIRYFRNLKRELESYHDDGFSFSTLYLGGGTPTVMPDKLSDLIGYVKKLWPIKEISVETTPADLTDEIIYTLRNAGVNRLSVGVQSFQDDLLLSVNRKEKYGTGDDIRAKLQDAKGKFDTLNVDLIFGLDGQTIEHVKNDMATITDLGIDQVTCYPLMKKLSDALPFADWLRQTLWEKKAYKVIRDSLLPEYSPSSAWCFSRKNGMIDEYIVEHPAYVGAGSGAFGYIDGSLVTNDFSIGRYVESVESGNRPTLFRRVFSSSEQFRYALLMQLFGGTVNLAKLTESTSRPKPLLARFTVGFLRLTRGIEKAGSSFRVRPSIAFLTVILMKIFFHGVSSLRGLCMDLPEGEISVEKIAIDD